MPFGRNYEFPDFESDFMVLVRHRGRRTQFYGPGRVVISCSVCGSNKSVEVTVPTV